MEKIKEIIEVCVEENQAMVKVLKGKMKEFEKMKANQIIDEKIDKIISEIRGIETETKPILMTVPLGTQAYMMQNIYIIFNN